MSDELSQELLRVLAAREVVHEDLKLPFKQRGPVTARFEHDPQGDGTRLVLRHAEREVRAAVPRAHESLPVDALSALHLVPAVEQLW